MVRIFIAYSSKDLVFKDEIRKRLRPLERAGKASIWDNWDIEGGAEWDAQIREKLEQSDLILLLLSPDALDSDYFYEVEAPIALRRHEAGEAIAVGILLRPCDLKYTPFGDLTRYELLPKKGHPVVHPHWHHADEAYLTIFQEVDILVERIEARNSEAVPPSHRPSLSVPNKNGQVIRSLPNSPSMVFVEGGTFQMGSNEDASEKPIHSVTVPSFWIGKFPVTFEEYDAFCEHTGKEKPADQGWGRGLRPVINVSWEDAQAYCQWLSAETGEQYHLPSESEWEFAARGGLLSKGSRFAGSNDISDVAWYYKNSNGKTHPVGEKKSNELGLHDMSGNVWEWCADTWHDSYKDAPNEGPAWVSGGEQDLAVLRGGSWYVNVNSCRASARSRGYRSLRNGIVGLRVVRAAGGE